VFGSRCFGIVRSFETAMISGSERVEAASATTVSSAVDAIDALRSFIREDGSKSRGKGQVILIVSVIVVVQTSTLEDSLEANQPMGLASIDFMSVNKLRANRQEPNSASAKNKHRTKWF